jgi:anti-sigma factor RsiW
MLVQLVTEYLEGALVDEDRLRFEAHLGRCPPCEVYLVQMRRTIDVCGHIRSHAISAEIRESLLTAFEGWKVGR